MSFRMFVIMSGAAVVVIGVALAAVGGASAHEERTIGEYEVEVGFNEEPALVNQLNGVFLSVMKEGVPIEGLDVSLKVEVIVGGGAAKKDFSFQAVEGEPGSYVAAFLPTVTGDYTFHIFGEIDGTAIDESFESGPGRFDSVESLDEVAFPEAVSDPGGLSTAVTELQAKIDSLDSSSSSDSTARTLGVLGIVVGLAGFVAGGFAATRRRS